MKKYLVSGNIAGSLFLLVFSVLLSGCDRSRNTTGWDYFPDMFYSTAYETYSENPNFENGMTMRVPVEGTVPQGVMPFHYTIEDESRVKAGLELTNPLTATSESLLRGEQVYTIFCNNCHGIKGDGQGHLYTSGKYPFEPRPLIGVEAENLKDGEIFHTIALGFGAMGAHGSQIRTEDVWRVVLHVRELQKEARDTSLITR
jgi:cytochrome c5